MTPAGLLVGLAVAAPTLYAALVQGSVPVDVALERLLIILVVTGMVWGLIHKLFDGFAQQAQRVRNDEAPNARDGARVERRTRN